MLSAEMAYADSRALIHLQPLVSVRPAQHIAIEKAMPYLKLPRGMVHYTAEGSGPPLLLLHANPGDSRDFDGVIPALASHHRVIAIDWPGYGQSELPIHPEATSVLSFYETLKELITAMSLPPTWIIGNSVGGNVAARLAAEHPEAVRGLVLVAPGGFTRHNMATRLFCRLQGSQYSLSPRLFAGLYLRRRTEYVKVMLERAAGPQSEFERRALNRALWRDFARPENDLREVAKAIRAPVLLVFGQFDPAIPAKRDGLVARSVLPNARFVSLPCGHAPFAEIPSQFLALVEEFMDGS